MEDAKMSIEEKCHPKHPLNNKEGSLRGVEIWVDQNDSQDKKN